MPSVIQICNFALSHIRAGSINSLTESSKEAQVCTLFYSTLRDTVLEAHDWQFNNKIDDLALLSTTSFGWVYNYQYPSDALKINKILPRESDVTSVSGLSSSYYYDNYSRLKTMPNRQIEYKIFNVSDNLVIATNEVDAKINYRAKVTNPNLFTNQFAMALSHLLAANIAVAIVGDSKGSVFQEKNLNLYQSYLNSATINDLNEQYSIQPESDYINIQ